MRGIAGIAAILASSSLSAHDVGNAAAVDAALFPVGDFAAFGGTGRPGFSGRGVKADQRRAKKRRAKKRQRQHARRTR